METGDKPKFDLITASKSKKYKIITVVVLILGVLLLGGGLLMKGFNTATVVPNTLEIVKSEFSGLTVTNGELTCDISIDQPFILKTGTDSDRALATPITFTLLNGAEKFLKVCDSELEQITESRFPGLFYLSILDNAPAYVTNPENGEPMRPEGILRITCGSFMQEVKLTYYQV